MRAQRLADTIDAALQAAARHDPVVRGEVIWLRDLARCLARLEAAVEQLAADAGTGPARRVKAILDGVDNERVGS